MRALSRLLAAALACAATLSHAGMGVTQVQGATADAPLTVFYPTDAAEHRVVRPPFSFRLAEGAAPRRGNGRLVIVSHGSGGGPWVHHDIARALVDAGFVVALPLHHGDNWRDTSQQGPQSWKTRPAEVSRAIDSMGADARFAPLLALDKVGVFGQSAGGHTALSLAGGHWSPARFRDHCDRHLEEDFPACVGTYTRLRGNWFDGLKIQVARGVLRQRFDDAQPVVHTDARIRAAVAGVPAAADFDLATLAQPAVPLGLVTAGRDIWLKPRFHGERVLQACLPRCEHIAHVETGGHSILLSPLPPMDVLGALEQELLADPPGFDRAALREVDAKIAAFFRRHLLP
jgi:predicted dienelactone hydrolase